MGIGIDKIEFEDMNDCIAHFRKIWKVPAELDDSVFHCFIEDFMNNPAKYEMTDEEKAKINFKKIPRPTFAADPIIHEGKVEIYNTPEEIAEVQAKTQYPEINPMDILSPELAEELLSKNKNLCQD